mmetsp:Transcript_23947/g.59431  ORF Transcript_23947/g.59431 Transcript_23947/m.59431 type:complete len:228 (+) Transcript_23947:382-1065(+)
MLDGSTQPGKPAPRTSSPVQARTVRSTCGPMRTRPACATTRPRKDIASWKRAAKLNHAQGWVVHLALGIAARQAHVCACGNPSSHVAGFHLRFAKQSVGTVNGRGENCGNAPGREKGRRSCPFSSAMSCAQTSLECSTKSPRIASLVTSSAWSVAANLAKCSELTPQLGCTSFADADVDSLGSARERLSLASLRFASSSRNRDWSSSSVSNNLSSRDILEWNMIFVQ